MSLARLWADRERGSEAVTASRQLYGWFTERFDTPHLRQATALL